MALKTMTDLAFQRAFRAHWRWLARTGNGLDRKCDFIMFGRLIDKARSELAPAITIALSNGCFACGAAYQRLKDAGQCKCVCCPISWTTKSTKTCTPCFKSLYGKWFNARLRKKRMELARQIAELPWQKEKCNEQSNNSVQ